MWADANGSCDIVRIAWKRDSRRERSAVGVVWDPGLDRAAAPAALERESGLAAGRDRVRVRAPDGGGTRIRCGGFELGLDVRRRALADPSASNGRRAGCTRESAFKGSWFQFTFLPLRIDTPRGVLNVEVGGALSVATGTAGEKELTVSTKRSASLSQAGGMGTRSESPRSTAAAKPKCHARSRGSPFIRNAAASESYGRTSPPRPRVGPSSDKADAIAPRRAVRAARSIATVIASASPSSD